MSIRTKVLGLVDVMMRVPPILIIDEILKIGMGLPTRFYPGYNMTSVDGTNSSNVINVESSTFSSSVVNSTNTVLSQAVNNASNAAVSEGMLSRSFTDMMDDLAQEDTFSDILALTSIKFIICVLGFFAASCVFMLWTRHLVMVYMYVISLSLTFLSYWSNVATVKLLQSSPCVIIDIASFNTTRLLDPTGAVMSLIPHLVAQWFMGMLFAYIHLGPRYKLLQRAMPLIYAIPIILSIFPLPAKFTHYLPVVAVTAPMVLSKIVLFGSTMEAGKTIYNGYQYAMNFISNFGLSALIENEWQRLNVPSVLRVFWTIRIVQQFISIAMSDGLTTDNFMPTMQKLLVDGCETLTAVLGMTSIISVLCHYVGKAFQWFLLAFDADEEKSLGTVSAVLFYILALQTGLTSLPPEKRFVRLCRNLCLLVTALLHFLHNIVSPILMSLSAARNPSRKRHLRALLVCAFLITAPLSLLIYLWSRHEPSTWLLAVTAFSVEVIVKVLVSLAIYTLFLLDARRQTFWEKLDDYLYYVRAFGNSVEFCFGILLFFNGAWILIFESGGAIRAIMMCIHAYFNIWCEARAGWSVFMKRRSAVHKISALPEASPAQLRDFDDVCAICYQEMFSAKITRCRHFFHGVCLRKWLYVQDRCPLCHEIMMYTEKNDDSEDSADVENNDAAAQPEARDTDNTQRATESNVNVAQFSTDPSTTSAATSATSATAAAVATVAASNTPHGFRLSPDMIMRD
ncbi:protein TRC8 homolog isoform X2 [Teleopsis dalmanni]|uniref:protein TRC8 homolog isoform X2 n=1 Tax=Teleopsis dalmanni TaxID=139649 RepID=UPI0018CDFED2|nr:protein TRC8 homolog isoform X2 [Teleopsis dalmanni]